MRIRRECYKLLVGDTSFDVDELRGRTAPPGFLTALRRLYLDGPFSWQEKRVLQSLRASPDFFTDLESMIRPYGQPPTSLHGYLQYCLAQPGDSVDCKEAVAGVHELVSAYAREHRLLLPYHRLPREPGHASAPVWLGNVPLYVDDVHGSIDFREVLYARMRAYDAPCVGPYIIQRATGSSKFLQLPPDTPAFYWVPWQEATVIPCKKQTADVLYSDELRAFEGVVARPVRMVHQLA